MYYINKIVGFLVSPLGGVLAGGLLSAVCARRGRMRLARWLVGLTAVWLWLWMTPLMTWVVGVPLEREFLVDGRVPTVETFPAADAIVLLGGSMGMETNSGSYAEMASSADRVWQAVRLFKAEKAPRIIATGDQAKDTTLPLLRDFGVGEDAVSFLDARTTEEEARGIGEMLGRDGSRPKVLLVTSAWHMRRARMMFGKYAPAVEVVCAPADFENLATATRKFPLLPDPYCFHVNSVAFHEWVGIVGYRIFR